MKGDKKGGKGWKGEKGEKGEKGDKGDKGIRAGCRTDAPWHGSFRPGTLSP